MSGINLVQHNHVQQDNEKSRLLFLFFRDQIDFGEKLVKFVVEN